MASAVAPEPVVATPEPVAPPAVVAPVAEPAAAVVPPVEPTVVEPPKEPKDERPRGPDGKFLPKTEDPADAPKPDAKVETDYSTVQLPKDATIDPAVLERTVAIARERGLSPEQAQATLDLVANEVKASSEALLKSHAPGGEAWTKKVDGWRAETLADTKLGKTPEERMAAVKLGADVIRKIGEADPADAEAFKGFLDTSGLGDNPTVVRVLAHLGRMGAEKPISLPTSNGAPKTLAEIFYPKGANRTEEQVMKDP